MPVWLKTTVTWPFPKEYQQLYWLSCSGGSCVLLSVFGKAKTFSCGVQTERFFILNDLFTSCVCVFKVNVGCLSICSLSCIRDVGVSPVEMRENGTLVGSVGYEKIQVASVIVSKKK